MSQVNNIEKRVFKVEMRSNENRTVTGHAAVFNSYSEDFGGWKEVIEPGAFRDAIAVSDVRALYNHDSNHLLGRTTSSTLKLSEDERGLAYDLSMPKHRDDLVELIERGDLTQNSFAFRVKNDRWEKRDGMDVRVIEKVERLYDISLVTYPAYPDTDVAMRSWQAFKETINPEDPTPPAPDYSDYELQLTLQKHTL